jgi:hypothetical protein
MRGIPLMMKIRCEWLAIPVLLSALTIQGAAQSPAPSTSAVGNPTSPSSDVPISPSDLYARAFLANHMADELAAEGHLEDAAEKYHQATSFFEAVRSGYPDWRTDMIEFRLQWNNKALEETLAKLRGQLLPVPPQAIEDIPRALPVELPAPAGVEMVSASNKETPGNAAIPKAVSSPLPSGNRRGKKLKVLILGDSMAIGGFGEKLDALFRADSGVAEVHTYIACGTNPLSWMKRAPYTNATTRCGYWSIESVPGEEKPREIQDVYGMTRGHRPGSHTVPKIEDLVASHQPDILIMQNGNNFFSSFADGKTIVENTHGPMIHTHVAPLVEWLAANGSSIRKFYWISPPEAGNVTPEIQQYVFERIANEVKGLGTMIDSRSFTSYPYKAQGSDKEHFWGNECIAWGADTFAAIANDLSQSLIWNSPVLTARAPRATVEQPVITVATPDSVSVRAKLLARTAIPQPADFAPYGERLVAFLYKISSVTKGQYDGKEILVFHPAYIHHTREDLSGYRVGKTYRLDLVPFTAESVWTTVGQDDSVGDPLMMPYMLATDVARHPNLAAADCCGGN